MEFDRTLSAAEALLKRPTLPKPLRTSLNDAEIKRMAEYVYAKALAWDERSRYGRDELRRIEAEHERLEGPLRGPWAFPMRPCQSGFSAVPPWVLAHLVAAG